MAELTISIPDDLKRRLEPLRERLPQLLEQLLDTAPLFSEIDSTEINSTSTSVYAEVLDFLIKRPTLSEIIAFKVSPKAQERLLSLLDKNRESALTQEETAELDIYEQLEHLMILLKAHAINSIN